MCVAQPEKKQEMVRENGTLTHFSIVSRLQKLSNTRQYLVVMMVVESLRPDLDLYLCLDTES